MWEKLRFKGTFRDYQARVLARADNYIKDGKIHVVAAPGSGKTILGLELIRRLGKPCLILSPTTAIRDQWGERFRDWFLPEGADFGALFSADPHDLRAMNSITYQGLYAAMPRPEDGELPPETEAPFVTAIRQNGIETICLDEAHHLRNEWQKALEAFLAALGHSVKIIALTATPPYDSETAEWARYQKVCGDIDEEIFVPELVERKNLCPHQDYLYFNYPTRNETKAFDDFKDNAARALSEIGELPFWPRTAEKLNDIRDYETLFSQPKGYIALCAMLRYYGFEVRERLIRELCGGGKLPRFSPEFAEVALTFLLEAEDTPEDFKEAIISVLRQNGCYEKRRVTLNLTDSLKRTIISSAGKLQSIKAIAGAEFASLGQRLHQLILTDYIKKEETTKIGREDAEFNAVHIVSIFETLRRALPAADLAVLSGSLVILPRKLVPSDGSCEASLFPGTAYAAVNFRGGTPQALTVVGRLFEEGDVQILIGTKSLLGEGWDSPCINSLILASFVGSFVLSNQMRGRAIRVDPKDPQKTANIWHLVTLEPEYIFHDKALSRAAAAASMRHDVITSCDFDVVKRRFDTFLGPDYETLEIESGLNRVSILKPPYDRKGIAKINEQMLALAADRAAVRDKWLGEVLNPHFETVAEASVPKDRMVPGFAFINAGLAVILTLAELFIFRIIYYLLVMRAYSGAAAGIFLAGILTAFLMYFIRMAFCHFNPGRSIKSLCNAVYKTLHDTELIDSSARPEYVADTNGFFIGIYLRNASLHDQNIFTTAVRELLSPIENPRYILISKYLNLFYNYRLSFACPSVIGQKREYVDVLTRHLAAVSGRFTAVYTYRENGRKLILKCRRKSYLTFNQKQIDEKYKVSRWE